MLDIRYEDEALLILESRRAFWYILLPKTFLILSIMK